MKFEFSAGGIVYKNEDKKIMILVSQHSQHHGWVFPKGLIGDHPSASFGKAQGKSSGQVETKEEAAIREVKEETGIDAKIIKELKPVTYWYVFNKEKIKKTVYYYIMEHLGGSFKERDHEMENVEWLTPDKVEERLTYKSDKEVWKEAKKIILATGN